MTKFHHFLLKYFFRRKFRKKTLDTLKRLYALLSLASHYQHLETILEPQITRSDHLEHQLNGFKP